MDSSHIIRDDRLNLNQTRRFAVGDIVKLKAVPTGDPKKSKFALVEEVRIVNDKKKLFGPCFEKARLSDGPRPKYVDDEPSGVLYRHPETHELCFRKQKLEAFDLHWSRYSGRARESGVAEEEPEWYDAVYREMVDDRTRKDNERREVKMQVGATIEDCEEVSVEKSDSIALDAISEDDYSAKDSEKGVNQSLQQSLKIMQWNQKSLTNRPSSADDEGDSEALKRHAQRTKNLYETIRCQRPAVVVMQEVTRKGEETIKEICDMLNAFNRKLSVKQEKHASSGTRKPIHYGGTKEGNWKWGVSEPVDMRLNDAYDKGREYGSEVYAVIYQESLMGRVQGRFNEDGSEAEVTNKESHVGQVLFKHGFAPISKPSTARAMRSAVVEDEGMHEPVETIHLLDGEDRLTPVNVNMKRVTDVFEKAARIKGGVRGRFLHRPVLFHFPKSNFGPISIVSNHLAASETATSMQNVMEAAYVQHLCTELKAKMDRQVILLGDFNVSQTNNEAMWNSDDEMPGDGDEDEDEVEEDDHPTFSQRALLPIRNDFRAHYLRAFDEKISTNVFPFLGGLTAEPAHNDDIWLPIARNSETDKLTHTHPGTDGRVHSTKLVPVPANILNAWSNEATDYLCVKKGSGGNKKVPRAKITQRLAYMWSDHKPMWARVWCKPDANVDAKASK